MNFSPEMMAQAQEMMKNMSPEQLDQTKKMAQNMYQNGQMPPGFPGPGAPGAGGGMPGYRPGAGNGVPPAPAVSPDQDLPPAAKSDLDQAREVKDQAASDFKAKNYTGATEKYFNILNIIRQNDELKKSPAGQELETQARLNIALCKINEKEYDVAIDQCERVLDRHPNNHKACFRLATAMYETSDKCTKAGAEGSIRGVHNYAKKACAGAPNDKKLREFYDEVKVKFDAYKAAQDALNAKAKEEEKQAAPEKEKEAAPVVPEKSEQEKKGLRRVIVTDPEEEKAKAKKEEKTEPAWKAEEPIIQEDQKTQTAPAAQPQAQNPGLGANMPDVQQNMNQMQGMTDEQLAGQINTMKSNRHMARQAFAGRTGPNGQPIDDAQLDMMLNMMTPQMMRMSMQFAQANPDMVRSQMGGMGGGMPTAQPPAAAPRVAQEPEQIDSTSRPSAASTAPPATTAAAAPNPFGAGMPNMDEMMNNPMVKEMMNNPETMKMMQNMMQGQGGAAGADPSQMNDLMQNPSMEKMLQNPEMIANCVNMVKSNPAMMEMMAKQTGVDPSTMVKGLEWMATLAGYYASTRRFFANKFVQLTIIALVVSLIWRYFG